MKQGMEPFLVLNRTISSKSVASTRHTGSCFSLFTPFFVNPRNALQGAKKRTLHLCGITARMKIHAAHTQVLTEVYCSFISQGYQQNKDFMNFRFDANITHTVQGPTGYKC